MPSLLAAIGGVIEKHMVDTGFLKRDANRRHSFLGRDGGGDRPSVAQCPRCGEAGLIFQEGCAYCPNCGYSKCG